MLKKKILLGMLVLGLGTACITQATTMVINVGETVNYNGVTITCDNNANCTSTIGEESFLGLAQNTDIANGQTLFWNSDGTIGYLRGNARGAGTVWQRYINSGCPTTYTNGTTYTDYVTDNIPGCSNTTENYQAWIQNTALGGKLTSITFNTFGNQGTNCYNYNEDLGSFCVQYTYNALTEATDYGITYPTTIEKINTIATTSPFAGGGSESGGENNYIKLPMCYTIQQKIDTFPSNYNTGMCYSTNKIWSGNQFITVTPKSMLELWPTYQEYENDVNLYQNYCGNYVANNTACGEAFSGKEDKRSIINKLYNQGTQTILRSYDYCYLQLNFTEEQKNTRTNCTMGTGLQHGSGITTDEIIEDMKNHRITIITPDGTTVYSGFRNNEDVEEEANLSYDGIIETMQSVRGKLTNIFYYRSGVTGIIPDYITRILLLIVLFAIFKK